MLRKFDRLMIPFFQKYKCPDFTKIFIDYYKNNLQNIILNFDKKKIPLNERWECRDFKLNSKNNQTK